MNWHLPRYNKATTTTRTTGKAGQQHAPHRTQLRRNIWLVFPSAADWLENH